MKLRRLFQLIFVIKCITYFLIVTKDRDLARGMIGELFKNERPSGTPKGTTYEQYYSKPYVEWWNTYQKLLRYRNGRRR